VASNKAYVNQMQEEDTFENKIHNCLEFLIDSVAKCHTPVYVEEEPSIEPKTKCSHVSWTPTIIYWTY